jgi:hypothetical protein
MEQPIEDLIKKYLETKEIWYAQEQEIEKYFRAKIQADLDKTMTAEDFHQVKCQLIDMPDSASKVLIFRTILILEDRKLGNA